MQGSEPLKKIKSGTAVTGEGKEGNLMGRGCQQVVCLSDHKLARWYSVAPH